MSKTETKKKHNIYKKLEILCRWNRETLGFDGWWVFFLDCIQANQNACNITQLQDMLIYLTETNHQSEQNKKPNTQSRKQLHLSWFVLWLMCSFFWTPSRWSEIKSTTRFTCKTTRLFLSDQPVFVLTRLQLLEQAKESRVFKGTVSSVGLTKILFRSFSDRNFTGGYFCETLEEKMNSLVMTVSRPKTHNYLTFKKGSIINL